MYILNYIISLFIDLVLYIPIDREFLIILIMYLIIIPFS